MVQANLLWCKFPCHSLLCFISAHAVFLHCGGELVLTPFCKERDVLSHKAIMLQNWISFYRGMYLSI